MTMHTERILYFDETLHEWVADTIEIEEIQENHSDGGNETSEPGRDTEHTGLSEVKLP